MESTPKDPKPDDGSAAPEEGESYEDSWYQVLRRRAEEKPDHATEPPADQKTDQKTDHESKE